VKMAKYQVPVVYRGVCFVTVDEADTPEEAERLAKFLFLDGAPSAIPEYETFEYANAPVLIEKIAE